MTECEMRIATLVSNELIEYHRGGNERRAMLGSSHSATAVMQTTRSPVFHPDTAGFAELRFCKAEPQRCAQEKGIALFLISLGSSSRPI